MKAAAPVLAALVFAAGCTTVVFEGTAGRLPLMPDQVHDDHHVGETVVWGGRLISTRRSGEGFDLEVMAHPLDAANRPRLDLPPGGRFVAHFPGELDGAVFRPGVVVTLAGVLGEPRVAEIDGYNLVLPSVLTRRVHPWPQTRSP